MIECTSIFATLQRVQSSQAVAVLQESGAEAQGLRAADAQGRGAEVAAMFVRHLRPACKGAGT